MSHEVAAIGEVLWDVFPDGPRFGGAPANFACSLSVLGGEDVSVSMVSAVGPDDLGTRALEELRSRDVDVTNVQRNDRPTGRVDVTLDDDGVPSYEFATDSAWDRLAWTDDLESLADRVRAICYGTLGQRADESRELIRKFIACSPPNTLRMFDVNLRSPYDGDEVILDSLPYATAIKLNEDELERFRHLLQGSCPDDDVGAMHEIAARYDIGVVALTKGAAGAVIVRGGEVSEHRGQKVEVVDTVGAGDAFTAALVLGLLEDRPLDEINQSACEIAGRVCQKSGAIPSGPAME